MALLFQRAKVQIWEEYYNNKDNAQKLRKLETYQADQNGYFELKKAAGGHFRNIRFEISYGNDKLFLNRATDTYVYDGTGNKDTITEKTYLFTDRSIYRPGQTVYFKGILVSNNGKEKTNSVIPDRKTTVTLYDANGEKADSIVVTTNEFGSYSGKFILPTSLLNGEFTITDENTDSETRIHVEEYKRPKFYVESAPPKGTYRVNDSVKVEGNAKSYAGNSINGANVKYRVQRRANIPIMVFRFHATHLASVSATANRDHSRQHYH